MFVDFAKVHIKAGNGGDGRVSFHREKYVAAGGPDGGDGGRGGDIVMVADDNLSTLADFRYKRKYCAENGQAGGANRCFGKSTPDMVIRVPRGTLVKDAESGRIIADVSLDEPVIIAKGGKGGFGNARFATATRQIPRFAKPGQQGEELDVTLELKLLADVGLLGFPNVGKSTFLSVVSEAKPKIANYHFTTLTPVLGVVRLHEGASFVMADIPGLIEGAGTGAGLGHEFLRHVERCRLLVHILDASGSEGRDPKEDFEAINRELSAFNPELAEREQIVALNKCDMCDEEELSKLHKYFEDSGYAVFDMMAAIAEGTKPLVNYIAERISKLPPVKIYEPDPVEEVEEFVDNRAFDIMRDGDAFIIDAPWLHRLLENVDPDDYESLQYFQRTLQSSGIIEKLEQMGVNEGDTVRIDDIEFDYIP